MTNKTTTILQVALALLFIALLAMACGGQKPAQVQPTTAIATTAPDADGAALLQARCVRCHSLDTTKTARKTGAEWEATVARMRTKGASLTDAEAQVLIQYLAATYRK